MRRMMIMICIAAALPSAAQDSLAAYIREALRNNPSVTAGYKEYEAAMQGCTTAAALGDPELSAGFFPKAMEHVNGKQVATVSLMQMFPWPGTLKAAHKEMGWKAEAAYEKYRDSGIDVAFRVQKLWYQMIATKMKIKTVADNRRIIRDIEDIAIYKYKSPQNAMTGRMSDQVKIEAEVVRLDEQIESLQSEYELQAKQFNLLLHRDAASPLVIPDTLVMAEQQQFVLSGVDNHPKIRRIKALREAYSAQERKARKMGMPMIGVGIEYMINKKRDSSSMDDMGSMSDMSGMNMWMPMLKMSLPVYRRKVKAQQKAAQLMQEAAQLNMESVKDAIMSDFLAVEQKADDAKRKIGLYKKQTEILANSMEMMRQEYINGSAAMTDILQTERSITDIELRRIAAVADYNIVAAEYDRLLATNIQNDNINDR